MSMQQNDLINSINKIKRWWKYHLARHIKIIENTPLMLLNGRKHGKSIEILKSEDDLRCSTYEKTTSYLFGIPHGLQTKKYSYYCTICIPYKFGKKHGREFEDDIEYDPMTFRDWHEGVLHGLKHYQRYHNASLIEIMRNGSSVENKLYSHDKSFEKVFKWALDTEIVTHSEWNNVILP